MSEAAREVTGMKFWRDDALPFIEARTVRDGRRVCYAKHWHETFSIGLIARGRCRYVNCRQTIEVSAGTVVLMNPGDVHACNPIAGEPWSYRMLYIDVPWLCEQGMSGRHGFFPLAPIATRTLQLYDGLNRLIEILFSPNTQPLEKQTASVSFMELMRRCLGAALGEPPQRTPHLARAADFIRENCLRALKLEDISAQANLSQSHLIRAFRQAYGLTPHAFQLNCRIEHCRAQLRAGRPIAEVALGAGFSDQAHFQRTFKRFVATTPGQYRAWSR